MYWPLVLPASFAQGESWSDARALLSKHYQDLVVVTLANTGKNDRAFSADTGMAEVLVVAKKKDGTILQKAIKKIIQTKFNSQT